MHKDACVGCHYFDQMWALSSHAEQSLCWQRMFEEVLLCKTCVHSLHTEAVQDLYMEVCAKVKHEWFSVRTIIQSSMGFGMLGSLHTRQAILCCWVFLCCVSYPPLIRHPFDAYCYLHNKINISKLDLNTRQSAEGAWNTRNTSIQAASKL